MKCLLCLHYDVVNLGCMEIAKKMGLSDPVLVEPDWGCKDFKDATSTNVLDKLSQSVTDSLRITVDIGV